MNEASDQSGDTAPSDAAPSDTAPNADALDAARRLGRRQAEAFDSELRTVEASERERRLALAAWRPRVDRDFDDEEASLKVVHLEARLSELSAYVRAVDESLPWRVIQGIRRIFGRAW